MLKAIFTFYEKMQGLQDQGIMVRELIGNPVFDKVSRLKWYLGDEFEQRVTEVMKDIAELSPDTIMKEDT